MLIYKAIPIPHGTTTDRGVILQYIHLPALATTYTLDLIDFVHRIGNRNLTLYIRVRPHFLRARELNLPWLLLKTHAEDNIKNDIQDVVSLAIHGLVNNQLFP